MEQIKSPLQTCGTSRITFDGNTPHFKIPTPKTMKNIQNPDLLQAIKRSACPCKICKRSRAFEWFREKLPEDLRNDFTDFYEVMFDDLEYAETELEAIRRGLSNGGSGSAITKD